MRTAKPKLENNEVFLEYGIGCFKGGKKLICFRCPYPDCEADHKQFNLKEKVMKTR